MKFFSASARFGFPLLLFLCTAGQSQTFTGTNAPGGGTNFSFSVPAGATNLSLVISNSAPAYSYLLLKRGGTASDSVFDFASRLSGAVSNQINLELPEFFAPTNYDLRVSTPGASGAHGFSVLLTTNRADLRSTNYPVLKPLEFSTTGALATTGFGSWHYFQVDVPTNLTSGWRIVLSTNAVGGNPDLYVRRGARPTTGSFDFSSTGQQIDTLTFDTTAITTGTYFIGVFLPGGAAGASYTLSTELVYVRTLTWDPGTTHLGTQVFTNTSATGGDYFFKISTLNTANSIWRTALNVTGGEAEVYLRNGSLPTTLSYGFASTRAGSDGFVLEQGAHFNPAQDWFILVHATPGAQWNLVTGEAFVTQLPNLAADASSGTNATMGAEGMRFFKTTISVGTLAWRLGLNGLTNALLVRKTAAPHPLSTTYYDLQQAGQMLVVPTYLNIGDQYFVGVIGNPGLNFTLDSRQQAVTDIAFNSLTNLTVAATNYGYLTYRVQVPVQQIAWQLTVAPDSGDANIAVRQSAVPNEFVNGAFSDVTGGTADSVTLVPPTLSDGTFYVTVYGNAPYSGTLTNGQPVITDVNYVFAITNDAPNRVGWRFYRVANTAQQLGTLGWDLFLQNQPVGTEIALRRNAVPGRWNYRNSPFSYSQGPLGYVDYSGVNGFLQRPGHQADIWYVGVYHPNAALGNFVLTGQELNGALIPFGSNGTTNTVSGQPVGKFQYFRIDVPATVFGWDLRIQNVTSGDPRLVVCHDQLPISLSTPWGAFGSLSWPSGSSYQISANSVGDWTGYANDPGGVNRFGHILELGMGNPLQAGTYYVGILNGGGPGSGNPMSYQLVSRGIGTNNAIPVTDLAWTNGIVSVSGLGTREPVYYRVEVPSNAPSWKIKLTATAGESLLVMQRGFLPNVAASSEYAAYWSNGGKKMQKLGDEIYLQLPTGGLTNIVGGTYYLAVVGEGTNPVNGTIGSGTSSYTLTTLGSIGITNLGTLDSSGATDLIHTNSNEGTEAKAFQFTVPPGTLAMEVRLENTTGNPYMTLRADEQLPYGYESHGRDGGQNYFRAGNDIFNIPNPTPGVYSLMVSALADNNGYSPASYRIRVHALTGSPVAFDGGAISVTNQEFNTWRFFTVTVPANAFGWDLRITNVTSGDPRLVICRESAPVSVGTTFAAFYTSNWPTNGQIAADADWTGYNNAATGSVNEYGKVFAAGMGDPLAPGNYIVGVFPGYQAGTQPLSYTLASRGIGTNYSITIGTLTFSNGVVNGTNLSAREVAYYRLEVPTNMPDWKLKLTPTLGESLLMLQRNFLPGVGASIYNPPANLAGGKKIQKPGTDHYLLLPAYGGATNIPGGTYYLAVASEGQNPNFNNNGRIGTNAVNFTLTSFGTQGITDLGTVDNSGLTDITQNDGMEGSESRLYQFTVPPGTLSLEVHLDNRVANPQMTLRSDGQIPYPLDGFGSDGGQAYNWTSANLINIPNPVAGVYTLTVNAGNYNGGYTNTTYTVRLHALGTIPVNFSGGSASITNQAAGVWQYFVVNVPTNAFGWDLRLINVTSGDPRFAVRRDLLPDSLGTPWGPFFSTTWPSGYQIAATTDWTGYNATNGASETGHMLEVGMGNPLEPGLYYVGVINYSGTAPMSYTIASRGIGTNQIIPLVDLPFNGVVTNTGLLAREAAYYRVVVPSNSPNWKLRLAPTDGDALLIVQKDFLPNVGAAYYYTTYQLAGGKVMRKPGNEHYLGLPPTGTLGTNIPAGTYYVAVVSEGVNPNLANNGRLGSGVTSYSLQSLGSLGVPNLGTAGGADLLLTNSLEGGEMKIYRFAIPPGVLGVEVRLDNRTGNPYATMRPDSLPPYETEYYGKDGGENAVWSFPSLVTLANPVATNYTLDVFAASDSGSYPDANYTVVVHTLPTPDLNFDANLNTNGFTNVATATLADDQRAFYKVIVPATNNGVAVLGWKLSLASSQGTPYVRVCKNILPNDHAENSPTTFVTGEAAIVPPYLTPGTWYVEVKGIGTTVFTLTSSALTPERPAWLMPMAGQSVTTAGLPPNGALFGDTGVDTNGVALPGDQGVDLGQGKFHYYTIMVPSNNVGVLRTRLDAISGNPDLYIRFGDAPTLTHYLFGGGGSIYDRALTGSGTEYGNWVPWNGRFESFLTPGAWHLAVKAGGSSNVRYRLQVSTGDIQDLALNGGSFTGQTLAAGDWRYYRVTLPTNAPVNWNVTFSQQLGDVVMYVRDTTPPGLAGIYYDMRDWSYDSKNHGPYPNYDPPGTYTFSAPPLRPGNIYYVGFRAVNDATFSVSCTTNGGNINFTNTIPFYGGFTTNVIPPNGVLKFRIDVPGEAVRWLHTATHSNSVSLYLDQGSVPTATGSDHWTAIGQANSSLNQYLATPNSWPWQAGRMYFLFVTNNSAVAQPFSLALDGRNAATDDNDNDGVPDAWELQYFGNLSYTGNDDPDHDGVNNHDEFLDGTNPNSAASFRPRLTIIASHGTVTRNPAQSSYALGSNVVLTAAAADTNYLFLGWSGDATGTSNPLTVTMSTNKTITATFGFDASRPSADYRFQNTLASSVGTPPALQNIGAGNSFVTNTVDGVPRVVYQWPLNNGLLLSPATGVVPSNVWTMVLLFRFDTVSGYRRILDTKNPASEQGLYEVGGLMNFYPTAYGPGPVMAASNYVQVVLTRNDTNLVRCYVDGVSQFSFMDSSLYSTITGPTPWLRFFIDNGSENSAGAVARIRLFSAELPPEQIPLLDRLPASVGAPLQFITPMSYSNGVFRMTVTLTPNLNYQIQTSTNLTNWATFTNVLSPTTPVLITHPQAGSLFNRFYRGITP